MAELISKDKFYQAIGDKLTWLMRYGDEVYLGVGDDIRTVFAEQPTTTEAEIRDKAIEEFIDRLKNHEHENWIDYHEYGITWSDIALIERQMKGEVNETD